MNRVVSILMKRDGNTKEEALARIDEVRKRIESCNYDPEESEDIVMEELGLEMDYLEDILFF